MADRAVGLPRELAPGVFWLGDCMAIQHEGEWVHGYLSAYVVQGQTKSLLVDTGHVKDWDVLNRQLDQLLARGVPEIAYIFPTHSEVPHSINLGLWLKRFPQAVACGDVRDYHLIFPEYADRLVPYNVGDRIDLGNTTFVFMEAIIRDLVTSMWGYDTERRVLFPGDGFAYIHHHAAHECGKTAEELPDLPIAEFAAVFAEYALYWTKFTDLEPYIEQLEALLQSEHPIDVIAPAHGCPIVDPERTFSKFKEGLRLGGAERVAAAGRKGR